MKLFAAQNNFAADFGVDGDFQNYRRAEIVRLHLQRVFVRLEVNARQNRRHRLDSDGANHDLQRFNQIVLVTSELHAI